MPINYSLFRNHQKYSIRRDSVEELMQYDRYNKPQNSYVTGFRTEINKTSIYQKMVERNQCNLNDYQNLSQIGANSFTFRKHVHQLSRTPMDKPILGFVAYVGNDVCMDSLSEMTSPITFRNNILEGLDQLDQKVAEGSKVVLLGLVQGHLVWDIMAHRLHPLGITFKDFYNNLAFTGGNPCRTWLTPRKSVRRRATQRANELNQVLRDIALSATWNNMEVTYIPFGLDPIMKKIEQSGQSFHKYIQSADGFHPRLVFHTLLSDYIWNELERRTPHFLGPINKFNHDIQKWRKLNN